MNIISLFIYIFLEMMPQCYSMWMGVNKIIYNPKERYRMTNMNCPRCGTPMKPGFTKCHLCGHEIVPSLDTEISKYQINLRVAIVIGLCSGIMTGIFSLGLYNLIQLPPWGWGVVCVFTLLVIASLLYSSMKELKTSWEDLL